MPLLVGLPYFSCKLVSLIPCYNFSDFRYVESPSEEDGTNGSGGSDDLDAEIGGKIINKLYGRKDADDGLLVHESQASKKDVAGEMLISCNCFYRCISYHELLDYVLSWFQLVRVSKRGCIR